MRYLKASTAGLVSRGVSIACRLVSLPLVLGLLDAERYGLWLMLSSVFAWLALTDLGIPSALQNPLVERWSRSDFDGAARLLRFGLLSLSRIALVIAAAGMVIAVFVPISAWLQVRPAHAREFQVALAAGALLLAVSLPMRLVGILAYATGRAEVPPIMEIATQLLSLAFLGFFSYVGFGSLIALVIAVNLVQVALSVLVGGALLQQTGLGPRLPSVGSLSVEEKTRLHGKGFLFLLVLVGEGLVLQSDAFMIGAFKGSAAVTAFLVPQALFMQFLFLQNAFLRPLWATFTQLQAEGDRVALRRLLVRGVLLSAAAGVAFGLGFGLLGDRFVRLWTGGVIGVSPLLGWGLGAYAAVAAVGNCLALYCNAVGLVERRFAGVVVFGIVKVGAGCFWLASHEPEGLPLLYAGICASTDVAVLGWVARGHLRAMRPA